MYPWLDDILESHGEEPDSELRVAVTPDFLRKKIETADPAVRKPGKSVTSEPRNMTVRASSACPARLVAQAPSVLYGVPQHTTQGFKS